MVETLLHAYTPLLLWTSLGLILSRFIPERFPRLLGKLLYWVGVPLQLFVLAHHINLSHGGLIPWVAIGVLLLSLGLALIIWRCLQWLSTQTVEVAYGSLKLPVSIPFPGLTSLNRASLGSFILAAMLGNTGFVGLTLTQVLTSADTSDWAVLFSVTSNVAGTYGLAVLIASYFGQGETKPEWWSQLRTIVTVPCLWAFAFGLTTRSLPFPPVLESSLDRAVWVVIAAALLLVGLRLGTIRGWRSFELASLSTLLKVLIVPAIVGLAASGAGLVGDPRLVLVLMSGTPTGLSVLILAEVYDLDRDLLASSIALTFVGLLLVLPLWLAWFG